MTKIPDGFNRCGDAIQRLLVTFLDDAQLADLERQLDEQVIMTFAVDSEAAELAGALLIDVELAKFERAIRTLE